MTPTQKANRLDVEGKCIICGELRKSRRRGLCTKHYSQYDKHKKTLDPDAAQRWTEYLIKLGRLLPSKQGARNAEEDAFADSFEQFLSLEAMDSLVRQASEEDELSRQMEQDTAAARRKLRVAEGKNVYKGTKSRKKKSS